jgi:membrane fusion protein (multidrug efflux system)
MRIGYGWFSRLGTEPPRESVIFADEPVCPVRGTSCALGENGLIARGPLHIQNLHGIRVPYRPQLTRVLAIGFLTLAACRSEPPRAMPLPAAEGSERDPVVEVTTTRVRRGPILERVIAPGSVVARRESQIGTEVTGRVVAVFVSEGDRIEEGAPLFQIDPVPFEMGLRQARAGLDVARAERRQIEADLARAQALRRQDVVSQQDLDRLTTSLAVAEAHQRQAEEAVALAGRNLERTLVRAPYAGSVAARLVDEGTTALVQPQTIVVTIQETGELEAHAAIPESQLSTVQVGQRARIRIEGATEPIETVVSSVNDTIDPSTRTYLVKMRVPNPDRRLKSGVFAHVEILPEAKPDALLVPPGAIRTEDGRARLLVVRGGRATAVPVDVGVVSEQAAEILQGVEDGAEVLIGESARTIAPGMRVRPVAEEGGIS